MARIDTSTDTKPAEPVFVCPGCALRAMEFLGNVGYLYFPKDNTYRKHVYHPKFGWLSHKQANQLATVGAIRASVAHALNK